MRTTAGRLRASPTLSVGVLSADLLALGADLDRLQEAGVGTLHLDVMDGVFCPQMTVGPPVLAALPDSFVRDVHLMVDDPLLLLDEWVAAGADVLSFQVEATRHPQVVLERLDGTGVVRGVAIAPGTPLERIEPLLSDVDLVLLLTRDPRQPGGRHDPDVQGRVERMRALMEGADVALAVDGGVTLDMARAVGPYVDILVSGSAVFRGGAVRENAQALLAALTGVRGG